MRKILIPVILTFLLTNTIFSRDIEVGGGEFMVRHNLSSRATIGLTCLYTLPKNVEGSVADANYRHTVSSIIW